jgi:tRNA threonylcarbamoyladenosine biosynthesis protein TsaE
VPVYHLDVYRLDRVQDVIDLGFEELLDPEGVSFVEWGDAIEGLLMDDYLEVEMWTRAEDEGRVVLLTGNGRSWTNRWERLEAVAQPWMEPSQ